MILAKICGLMSKSMNMERYFHAACVLQEKIFVVGGYSSVCKVEKPIECYDPELDQWVVAGETERECIHHAVVGL